MTHFVGLVVAETEAELPALLQPFHEYESTGTEDEFVVEVDDTDELQADFEKHRAEKPNEGPATLEAFVPWWAGDRHTLREGRYYRRTNPNKKWDWWLVGGRWADAVPGSNCLIEEVTEHFPDYQPSVLIDAEGWHAAKDWGWFGFSTPSENPEVVAQKLAQHAGKRVWVVDFHI